MSDVDEPLSSFERWGGAALGLVMTAMGVWIFPYQMEQGDVLKALMGAGLAVVGAVFLVRSIAGRRMESVEKVVDFLSGLGS